MEPDASKKRSRSLRERSPNKVFDSGQEPSRTDKFKRQCPSTASATAGQHIVVHRVHCASEKPFHGDHEESATFDVPALGAGDNRTTALHGRRRLIDVEDYLEDNPDVLFVVYINYDCEEHHEGLKDNFTRIPMPKMPERISTTIKPYSYVLKDKSHPAEVVSEEIALSRRLRSLLQEISDQDTDGIVTWNPEDEFRFSYPELYHSRHLLNESLTNELKIQERNTLNALYNYLEKRLESDYKEAARLSEIGMTSRRSWAMLFRPGDVVIAIEESRIRAFTLTSCLSLSETKLELKCWTWDFDRSFFRRHTVLSNPWPTDTQECAITDLTAYPIGHAKDDIESRLRSRGKNFWPCRQRKYVNYSELSKVLITRLVT